MQSLSTSKRVTSQVVDYLRKWEGSCETSLEAMTMPPVEGLAALLDRLDIKSGLASGIPPLWHWLYFNPRACQSDIGPDGHPRVGGFLPPVPLPRRMWAGGRLHWHGSIRVGDDLRRTSTVDSVTHKAGQSGDLVFVVVRHEFRNKKHLLLTEEQDIVYRAPAQPGDNAPAPKAAPEGAVWSREIVADPVMLFRYSALTFNGHRIHYDRDYARDEEGYPGLVVHGPLIATLLADLATRNTGHKSFKRFRFRAVRPTYDLYPFKVCGIPSEDGKSARLWAQDHEGYLTMQADVEFNEA